ncbi:MAG: type II toxin-antitoxin system Phd/YefM family antitoxin [Acidimicrobiia bacterium]
MITATELRQNVYRILDQVVSTGEPVDVERKGKRLRIVLLPEPGMSRSDLASSLGFGDLIVGDPEDLVHLDWSENWQSDIP